MTWNYRVIAVDTHLTRRTPRRPHVATEYLERGDSVSAEGLTFLLRPQWRARVLDPWALDRLRVSRALPAR